MSNVAGVDKDGCGDLAISASRDTWTYRLFAWTGSSVAILFIAWLALRSPTALPRLLPLVSWTVVVLVVEQFPVVSKFGLRLDVDFPILLAAAFVFGPVTGGILAAAANVEPLEWRREISVTRAVFNRTIRALCVAAAGATFIALGGLRGRWPLALVAALAAVIIDVALNYALVAVSVCLRSRVRFTEAIVKLRLGSFRGFLLAYVAFGLLALPLTALYEQVGMWALLTFLIPVAIARQAFTRAQALEDANGELARRGEVIREVSEQIASERNDERLRIASSLHDDVLQSLQFLTLHAQVIREDLRHGRLLQLEEDVPLLLEVSRRTADLTRTVIHDLRESPLGRDGVGPTLSRLVSELREGFSGTITSHIEPVGGNCLSQTLVYQVARESLTNAVRHSGACRLSILLAERGLDVLLVVEDDGRGFEVADRPGHFGLPLMRERVAAAKGSLNLVSSPGGGTRVEARFPIGD